MYFFGQIQAMIRTVINSEWSLLASPFSNKKAAVLKVIIIVWTWNIWTFINIFEASSISVYYFWPRKKEKRGFVAKNSSRWRFSFFIFFVFSEGDNYVKIMFSCSHKKGERAREPASQRRRRLQGGSHLNTFDPKPPFSFFRIKIHKNNFEPGLTKQKLHTH